MKMRIYHRARGSALLITLFTASVIGLALSSYLLLVANQNVANMRSLAWNSAMPVIEGGIEEALTQLELNDLQHLSANQWTDLGNGWFYKSRSLDKRGYYEVMIQQADPPLIVSTASLPAPLAPSSSFGMILGSIVPNNPAAYVKRRVQVNTVRKPILPYAMLAQGKIDFTGGIGTDAFDSSDPMFSTFGRYDPAKIQASGDVLSNSGQQAVIDVGNGKINGKVGTGAGGTAVTGSNGSVGDLGWARGGNTGIEAGWGSDDVNIPIEDVQEPFTSGYATPIGGLVGITPYTYILDGRISQKYKLSSLSGKVYVTGGEVTLWVTDLVQFGGTDNIYIAPGATLKLYVSAPAATFSGNTIVNTAGTASNFQYYGLPSNKLLSFVGNTSFVGAIYAPQADLNLKGSGTSQYDFLGACVVNTVKMTGHFHFSYDLALRKQVWKGYMPAAWNELNPYAPVN